MALCQARKGIKINSRLVQQLFKKANQTLQKGLTVETITNHLKTAYKDYDTLKNKHHPCEIHSLSI